MSDQYARYEQDSTALAAIGAHIDPQVSRVTVRLPKALADVAVAAWNRDELDDLPDETPEQAEYRDQAAALALIGLAITQRGVQDCEELVVDLDVVSVAAALRAVP